MARERSILIVDDDPGVRRLLAAWVRDLGHRTFEADNAEDALALMRARPIDVALVDILMPGYDGTWLIDQMRRECLPTAVVIVTGLTALDPKVTLSAGVIDYLVKPFELEDITRAIRRAIASQLPPRVAMLEGATTSLA